MLPILFVEDDTTIAMGVEYSLKQDGFQVSLAYRPEEARDLGADDYLTKPYRLRELISRSRSAFSAGWFRARSFLSRVQVWLGVMCSAGFLYTCGWLKKFDYRYMEVEYG